MNEADRSIITHLDAACRRKSRITSLPLRNRSRVGRHEARLCYCMNSKKKSETLAYLDVDFFSSPSQPAMVDPSRLVEILPERVGSTSSPHFPYHNANSTDHSWSLQHFRSSLQTTITRLSPDRIELDLVGLDASIANALRRVLMAEVPTVAIESVYVWNNTSIVVDEVLSHRLGLVPLKIDPERLAFRGSELSCSSFDQSGTVLTAVFECSRAPNR